MHEYRMLPLPSALAERGKQAAAAAAANAFAEFVNAEASEGWEFYRVDTFTTYEYEKGCLTTLTGSGKKDVVGSSQYYVATFRRPK